MAPFNRRVLLTAILTCAGWFSSGPPAAAQVIQTATFSGHTYHLLAENRWAESETQAVALGGHLATVDSQAENDFIYNTFAPTANALATTGTRSLWIGLNDIQIEGTYVWESGQPVTYTSWLPGQPEGSFVDEDYAGIFIGGPNFPPAQFGMWHDIIAGTGFGDRTFGVVEVMPVPEPSSLLFASVAAVGFARLYRRRRSKQPV